MAQQYGHLVSPKMAAMQRHVAVVITVSVSIGLLHIYQPGYKSFLKGAYEALPAHQSWGEGSILAATSKQRMEYVHIEI